jgi:hypothetical protein
MAEQTFGCKAKCGYSDSMHRIAGGCKPTTGDTVFSAGDRRDDAEPTVVLPDAQKYAASVLLAAGAVAEENDRLKVRLGKAMQLTIRALTEESRNKSLALSRKALAVMKGVGES